MSSSRPRATLADYMVVGISPTLITFLVGSLVFFLVEVLYRGGFGGRLDVILGLFVMATVCVARISMEEGHAYAATFGAPLALVTGIAMMRFVEIRGPLASIGPFLNWGFLALIWWCSHKLTWDCTLLDDSTDASGQGLLHSMGLDGEADSDAATSGEASAVENQASPQPWWERWFANDKRPHTPGRWVVIFSLAALPIFGLGQCFLPAGDIASRRHAFWLMVIYVGSGLGLLLTTSFLTIRKYLRQRRLEMPVEMAAAWLGVGVCLIGALLLFSFLLPRPNSEYSIAQLPVQFTTPDRTTSRYAVGKDGQKQGPAPQGAKAGAQPDQNAEAAQAHNRQPTSPSEQAGNASPSKGAQPSSSPGSSSNSQSGGAGNQNQPGSEKSSQSSTSQSSQSRTQNSNQQNSGQQNSGQQDPASPNSGNNPTPSSNERADGQRSGEKQNPSSGESQPTPMNGQSSPSKASTSPPPAENQKPSPSPTSNPAPKSPPPPPESKSESPGSSGSPTPPPSLPSIPLPTLGSLPTLLTMFFVYALYLGIALLIAYFAWRYRAELVEAWRKLLAELRELWAKLFGRNPKSKVEAAPSAAVVPVSARSFASFADPFASGAARQMSPAQLVRYTFEALEAWARERQCPRHEGQTPHEFAVYLGQLAPGLDRDVKQLADWYGQIAYARSNPPPQAAGVLQQLWRMLLA